MKKRLMFAVSLLILMEAFAFQSSAFDFGFDVVPFDQLDNGERLDYSVIQEKIDKVYDALNIQKFDLKFTGEFAEIKEKIYEESNFDVDLFIGNLPDPFVAKRELQESLHIDPYFEKDCYYAAAEKIDEAGMPKLAKATRFVGIMSACPVSMYITVDSSDDSVVRPILAEYHFADGSVLTAESGSVYNKETHLLCNEEDNGVLGLGYNLDTETGVLITPVHVWMRNFGFCKFYDFAANNILPSCYDYETVRLNYEYDNKDYLMQMWKGTYFVTTGAEVGIYNKPKTRMVEFFDCAADDELLDMALVVTADGKDIVNTPMQKHWWINGFALTKKYYTAEEMTVICTVVCKDEKMLQAVAEQLAKNTDVLSYKTDGLTVTFIW